ncbi:alpha/beta fold hydrolase [Paramicrobacterium sp. CJ85]|uniref:alpha/beta fold hydrolase n=1 Tax=Paramicrobacterium sp. CJ85 TaxID=3445355 RepID=UPI003F5F38C2
MPETSPYAEDLRRMQVGDSRVVVRGSATRYWEYGDPDAETTVLVVHGFRGDHHGLEPVVAQLPRWRIIVPDLPGFGESDPFAHAAHNVESYAEWLIELADALQLTAASTVILGHSFGSIVASAAVARGLPCARVVLINPIGAPALEGPRGVLTRLAVLYYRLGALLPAPLGFALLRNPIIVRVMSITMAKTRDARTRRWIHGEHDAYFSSFADRDVVLEAFRASVSHDVTEYAPKIAQPTLLIASDRDDLTPIAAQRRLAGLFPQAVLRVIANVGHLIHYEAPTEAARYVRDFLRRVT